MKRWLTFISLLLLLVVNLPAWSQAKVQTIVPRQSITVGHSFQVQYVVQDLASFKGLQPPDFGTDFLLISGPGIYTGVVTIKGVPTNIQNYSYTLMPLRIGKLAVRGATANYKGGTVKAPDAFINSAYPAAASPRASSQLTAGEIEQKLQQHLFITAAVDKKEVYIGEPVVASFHLFSNITSASEVVKNPGLYGFTVVDMPAAEAPSGMPENRGGVLYDKHLLRKVQLYPMQAGNLLIDEMQVVNLLTVADPVNGKESEMQVMINSKPIAIQVKPLPVKTKPNDFSGAVGQFSLKAEMPQQTVAVGAVGRLLVTINGKGNFLQINAPDVKWPQKVEGFEPQVTENLQKDKVPVDGYRRYQYTFTADSLGNYAIPPLVLHYFNPVEKTYQTATTDSLFFEVVPEKKLLNPFRKNSPANGAGNYRWLLVAVAITVAALIWMALKKGKKKPVVEVQAPVITAPSLAYEAEINNIQEGNAEGCRQLQHLLYTFLKQQYGIQASSRTSVIEQLAAVPISEQQRNEFKLILELCGAVQYYGTQLTMPFTELQQRAAALIRQTSREQ